MALKVGELFASFNLDTSGIGSAVSSAEAKLASLGKGLAISGAAMTAAVTVPLKQAATAIYNTGSDFGAQMSKVFAIAGDSVTENAEAMEALRAKALEMGSTTQFTASQAGEAMEYMAMAGWKTEEMLSAVEPLMNLAAAAGADLGTTSDIVTDAMTAFGLSATDTVRIVKDGMEMDVNAVEYFADILAAASSNSNTNVTMLGESFKYAASLAGSLGYSVNDVAIALGLMANTGIKSTMAGTSLSRVIQNMAKPSKQVAAAMDELGISLYDSRGQTKSLRDIMADFRNVAKANNVDLADMTSKVEKLDEQFASGKISQEEYESQLEELTAGSGDFLANITAIAGARGLPGLLAIMNATDADFDKLTSAIDNSTGAAAKMKAVMLDNVKGDVTLFNSALEGLEITLFKLGEGGLRNVIQGATDLVDKFRTADPAIQSGTLRIAALAAAAGPVMAAMGGIISLLPTIARAFTIVSGPAAMLAMGLVAIGAAAIDSNNSIGKTFVKGITGAGKKFSQFGKDIKKQLPDLKKNMAVFLESIRVGIEDGLPDIMNGLGDLLITGLSALASNMGNIAKVSQTIVKTLADGLKQNMQSIVPAAAELVTNLAAGLISNVPAILAAGGTLFTSLIDAVGHINWAQVGTTIKTAITNALTEIRTNFYRLVFGDDPTEDDLGDWGALGSKLVENIKKGIKKAADNHKNFLGGLTLGEDYSPDDSWGTVAGKIWGKITASMDETLKNASELLKGLILGDDYTADASWDKVASAIWDKIKTAFSTLSSNAKDLIGTIALGDDYTADVSWGRIATGIWNRIKNTFAALKVSAKNLIGEIVLGADYTADESWGNIGQAIWDKIKSKLTSLGSNAKALIGELAYNGGEEGYQADASWENIGTALWEKVQSGITAGKDMSAAILEKIGNVEIDVSGVMTTVQNAGTFVTNLVDNMLKGRIDWGNKISEFAKRIGDQLASFGWDNIGTTLGKVANNIIQAIVSSIPNAIDAAGNAVDAGLSLAEGLLTAISSGFSAILSSDNGSGGFAGIVTQLVTGIVNAVKNLPNLLSGALSVGAQIANSIMGSITTAMKDVRASGIADTLSIAAVDLLKGLLTSITNFGENSDVQAFMINLGEGIRTSVAMIGNVIGSIISYIFSAEGITSIFNAGKALAGILWSGIEAVVSGFGELILGLFHLDSETLTRSAQTLESDIAAIMQGAFGGNVDDYQFQNIGQDAGRAVIDNFIQQIDGEYHAPAGTLKTFFKRAIEQAIKDGDLSGTDAALWQGRADALSEDFWNTLSTALKDNRGDLGKVDLFSILFEQTANDASIAADNGKIQEVLKQYGVDLGETAKTAINDGIAGVMDENGNDFAVEGFVGALADGEEPASEAALKVSDAVVKQFMLTMTEDNGKLIGSTWITSIQTGMSDVDIASFSSTLASIVASTFEGILNSGTGYTIGWNISVGIANGISAAASLVVDAAQNVAQSAIDAAQATLDIHSPSRVAENEIGMMYDRGLARGLLKGISLVVGAAKTVNENMHDQFLLGDMSHGTVYTARKTVQQTAEQTALATGGQNHQDPRAIGSAIADRLLEGEGSRIVFNVNGEDLAETLAPLISVIIATKAQEGRPEFA